MCGQPAGIAVLDIVADELTGSVVLTTSIGTASMLGIVINVRPAGLAAISSAVISIVVLVLAISSMATIVAVRRSGVATCPELFAMLSICFIIVTNLTAFNLGAALVEQGYVVTTWRYS